MINFVLQILGWFVVCAILMSFIEHQVHQNLMHKRNFLSRRLLMFKKVFEHHTILHHTEYHKIFSDAPRAPGDDRGIRLNVKEGLIEGLPFAALIACISPVGGVMFLLVVALHHFLWGQIHLEMHQPKVRFFSNWPIYRFLAMHHYLHHKHPHKNFNVVLPFADYVLRTNVAPSKSEIEDYRLERLGNQAAKELCETGARRK